MHSIGPHRYSQHTRGTWMRRDLPELPMFWGTTPGPSMLRETTPSASMTSDMTPLPERVYGEIDPAWDPNHKLTGIEPAWDPNHVLPDDGEYLNIMCKA